MDEKSFLQEIEILNEKMETIRLATYDNFAVQKATDNYVEKYLPFEI